MSDYDKGFEDARMGRQNNGTAGEYQDGWGEGVKHRTASGYIKFRSHGLFDKNGLCKFTGTPTRTLDDWFKNPVRRKALDCLILGAVWFKLSGVTPHG